MNDVAALLMASSRTSALNVLVALLILGPLPVAKAEIERVGKLDGESAKRGLDVLLTLGLVSHIGTEKRTAWRITPAGKRLAGALFQLAAAIPDDQALPAPLPLQLDGPLSTPVDNFPAQPPLQAEDSPRLQAGQPVIHTLEGDPKAVKPLSLFEPGKQGAPGADSKAVKPPSVPPGVVVVKDLNHQSSESFNNNNIARHPKAVKPPSGAERGRARHLAELTRALLLKGVPQPAEADPLPPDLRLCAEQLVKLGCGRNKAELAVVRSQWTGPEIIAQIGEWKAYRASPAGRNLDHRFCYLVAARIAAAHPCPPITTARPAESEADDPTDPHRFDGWLAYASNNPPEDS